MSTTRLSSRLSSRRRSEPNHRWIRVVMAVLATIGMIDTGTITLKRWGVIGQLTCPGGAEGCDKVLNSVWGSFFGQPLSLFGFLAYTAVLLLALLPLVLRGELRTSLSERSWWGLFLLTGGMLVFSLLLMGLLIFKIQAFCFFCVLSAVLSLLLFVLSLFGGDWEDRGQLVFRGVIVALVVGLAGLGWAASVDRPAALTTKGTPPPVVRASTPATIALAEHLKAQGAVMYSAYWCPHCHEQKELFGKEAAAKLTVVECAPDGVNNQRALCEAKKIEGFPSWEINGRMESGVKPLARLAEWSGFKGPVAP
ncbi:vitamin K epoxide reductase family protein [Synechococcus sp. CS-1324]|uniref:vitamin K epoxide reductase family protein n=1 Tax=unclassified Synechococcus TaxID=2626047 RepID=UPI000DB47473|nr:MULTISPECIES: vitamin K epoxide reductase family protein [unclassified Synechococcus]MCT0212199.1 vitamin K epoxide reductase family protein [Synechococcus sp. CS-1326]MCT0230464.1 vitamin K epoxide reductase family protein [Synechococcus sp. CS-1324]MCT0233396.1 vitamin K epoxide reductase family protein [Synechococcus sp. CS-1327]PZV03337.1 MAG: thioredoxin [Cyanobium sp.]